MIKKETYEKALKTVADYKGRNPRELSANELGALVAARLLVQRYREENPER